MFIRSSRVVVALFLGLFSIISVSCGQLSPQDASRLQSESNEGFVLRGEKIRTGSFINPVTALAYVKKFDSYKDVVIISPGGEIPAAAMSGLAEKLAAKGHVVYVVEYLLNLAITQQNNSAKLAENLKTEVIDALPASIQKLQQDPTTAFHVFGHSLGGAVLGAQIGVEDSAFSSITLLGVSSLVSKPETTLVNTSFILGELDGLADRSTTKALASELGASFELLSKVNHFCVITDKEAGAADKRAEDLSTDISHDECLETIIEALPFQ